VEERARQIQRQGRAGAPEAGRESIAELIGQLAQESAELVRDQVELFRQEFRERFEVFKDGMVSLAVGLAVVVIAVGSLVAAAIIALAPVIGEWQAALAVGLALAVIAGIFILVGIKRFERARFKQ
jgi:sterol desaturase/sphingolipid hydroxylase (fatty acid hydroxylase superfamily)